VPEAKDVFKVELRKVGLRYFGPDANPQAPNVGDHKRYAAGGLA